MADVKIGTLIWDNRLEDNVYIRTEVQVKKYSFVAPECVVEISNETIIKSLYKQIKRKETTDKNEILDRLLEDIKNFNSDFAKYLICNDVLIDEALRRLGEDNAK